MYNELQTRFRVGANELKTKKILQEGYAENCNCRTQANVI